MGSKTPLGMRLLYHGSSFASSIAMFYFSRPGSSWFSWHPFLMTTSVGLLMSQGLMLFSDDFNLFPVTKKNSKITLHWIIQGCSMAVLYVGFAAIYITKNDNSKPHFVTWHGYLGLIMIILASGSAVGGNILKYRIKVPLVPKKTVLALHALVGKISLLLGCSVLTLGVVASDWASKEMNVWGRGGITAMSIITAGLVVHETRKVIIASQKTNKKSSK